MKHRHIVKLHGTYRHGDVFTHLFEPAADHDLRSCLELAEFYHIQKNKLPSDINFMKRSFGCLANALACVHAAGHDHGDIRPENILVHHQRFYLSNFSLTFISDIGTTRSGRGNQPLHRFMGLFSRFPFGRRGESQTLGGTERQQSQQVTISLSQGFPAYPTDKQQPGPYQPPEWQPTSVGQPTADIFALGCVFREINTVLCGRRVRDFEDFRANDEGEVAYDRTLTKTLGWLSTMENKEQENQETFKNVIRSMMETDASKRPKAENVALIMRECKGCSGLVFSGDCKLLYLRLNESPSMLHVCISSKGLRTWR